MITGDQIEKSWECPMKALKKLSWHEAWRDGMETIEVEINGFRTDRGKLRVYYNYISPSTGKTLFDSDVSSQFKIK